MTDVDWYFDFVSGFAYLQFESFGRLPDEVRVRCRPVLLAGLLAHHAHKGPAEIPEKRRFTYRQWVWQAQHLNIPFKMPPAHPFNPLPALRLALALGCEFEVIRAIFRFIWREGQSIEEPESWRRLTASLGIADAEARIGAPEVKAGLRANGEEAAALGIFGVPTFVAGGELFWGADATDMVVDYLKDPALFDGAEMARVSRLPIGTARRI